MKSGIVKWLPRVIALFGAGGFLGDIAWSDTLNPGAIQGDVIGAVSSLATAWLAHWGLNTEKVSGWLGVGRNMYRRLSDLPPEVVDELDLILKCGKQGWDETQLKARYDQQWAAISRQFKVNAST